MVGVDGPKGVHHIRAAVQAEDQFSVVLTLMPCEKLLGFHKLFNFRSSEKICGRGNFFKNYFSFTFSSFNQ